MLDAGLFFGNNNSNLIVTYGPSYDVARFACTGIAINPSGMLVLNASNSIAHAAVVTGATGQNITCTSSAGVGKNMVC